jgi:hypothetical protein
MTPSFFKSCWAAGEWTFQGLVPAYEVEIHQTVIRDHPPAAVTLDIDDALDHVRIRRAAPYYPESSGRETWLEPFWVDGFLVKTRGRALLSYCLATRFMKSRNSIRRRRLAFIKAVREGRFTAISEV